MDLVVPILGPKSYSFRGIEVKFSDMKHTEKGFEFKVVAKSEGDSVISLKADKVLIDDYAFDVNFSIDKVEDTDVDGTIKIAQTDLDKYNIISFTDLKIFFECTDIEKGEKNIQKVDVALVSNIKYDNIVKGLIEIYNLYDTKLSYYRIDTDKDNTYIYFHVKNNNNYKKIISIKKLLINGKIYDYKDLNTEVYNLAQEIFYITIPKKDVKRVNDMTISFFITGKAPEEKNDTIYITTDYSREFVK